jgi:hypothetical protein
VVEKVANIRPTRGRTTSTWPTPHASVRDRCLSLRRDLRRFRELTVLEPESFPGAHKRALVLLAQDVADLADAEQEVP